MLSKKLINLHNAHKLWRFFIFEINGKLFISLWQHLATDSGQLLVTKYQSELSSTKFKNNVLDKVGIRKNHVYGLVKISTELNIITRMSSTS